MRNYIFRGFQCYQNIKPLHEPTVTTHFETNIHCNLQTKLIHTNLTSKADVVFDHPWFTCEGDTGVN